MECNRTKDNLLHNVNTAIKQLQMQSCNVDDDDQARQSANAPQLECTEFTDNMWQVQELCHHLDCTLSHGLKRATGGYWTYVRELTHKSTVQLILTLPRAVSNVTRGWAWLYIALNDRAVESYLKAILEQPKLAKKHYLSHALLRDTQRLQVLIMMSAGLEHLPFALEPEAADLVISVNLSTTMVKNSDQTDVDGNQTDSAEEAESVSLASYSCGGGSEQDDDVDTDDPELGVVSIVTFDPVSGLPQENIVHSSTRAMRRRRKKTRSTSISNSSISKADAAISSPINIQQEHQPSLSPLSHQQQLTSEEIQFQRESLLNFILKTDVDFGSSSVDKLDRPMTDTKTPDQVEETEETSVYDVTSHFSVNPRRCDSADHVESFVKRVSFDPADDSVFVLVNPSMHERESPEGQEDPVMTTSITSLNVSDTKEEEQGSFKSSASALRSSWQVLDVDTAFVESTSKRLHSEIESEVREARRPTPRLMQGEIALENNFHLMLMLQVVRDQEEKVYKVFSVTTGHTEGSPLEAYVILTDKRFYLVHAESIQVDASVLFANIEFLQLSINYQIINLVCTQPRRRYWICTGNEQVTRNIVSTLEVSIRRCSPVKLSLPCVFTDSTAQSIALCRFISRETCLDTNSVTIEHYALVTWEDPHAASISDKDHPCGPSMEGHLMYRYIGHSVFGSDIWRPGYFRLKAGVCYLFTEPSDRTFKSYIQLVGGACAGCRRVQSAERPHTFELILSGGQRSLQLAAPSEVETSEWLQVFLQAVSQGCDDSEAITSPCVSACLIQASQMLFICHEVLETNAIRCLGKATVQDVAALHVSDTDPYCILEFETREATESSGDWVLYFSDTIEMNKFLSCLGSAWLEHFQVPLPSCPINDPVLQKHCLEWGKTKETPRRLSLK